MVYAGDACRVRLAEDWLTCTGASRITLRFIQATSFRGD